jgi:hypothetical protein
MSGRARFDVTNATRQKSLAFIDVYDVALSVALSVALKTNVTNTTLTLC